MFFIVLSALLGATPSPDPVPQCQPWREVVLDVARWQTQMRSPATRCAAMSSAGFDVGTAWECDHAAAPALDGLNHGARYLLPAEHGPAVVVLCVGASSGKCSAFVALRPLQQEHRWCRLSVFLPVPAGDGKVPYFAVKADREGVIQRLTAVTEYDCKVWQNGTAAVESCPGERFNFHWKVTSAGLVVREPELQLSLEEMSAQSERERGEAMDRAAAASRRAPVMFARARSVGTVPPTSIWGTEPGHELTALWWRGDQLCVTQDAKERIVRCYDPVRERWGKRRPVDDSMKRGATIGPAPVELQGRRLQLTSTVSLEEVTRCHGFEQLQVQDRTYPIASLDVDRVLPSGDYPTRRIVRLSLAPSENYGVAVVPKFEQLSLRTGPAPDGTLGCGDANINDWAVTSYELFVFASSP